MKPSPQLGQILLNFFSFFLIATSQLAHSKTTSLDEYLEEVRQGNQDYQAYSKSSRGAGLRSVESRFITGPHLFGDFRYGEEREEPESTARPNDVRGTEFTLGIAEQFSFGLGAKLSVKHGKYDLLGANPVFLPQSASHFYRTRPQLELNFPLYKNLFGKETRALRDGLYHRAKAKEHAESFSAKKLLATAETVYWKLALARALVKSSKENLERATKMRAWSSRRKNLGLADESSYLQSDANFELRQLEHQSAIDEERSTRLKFNSLRGVAHDLVPDVLPEAISAEAIEKLRIPQTFTEREDVKAQKAELEAKKASTIIDSEKFKPSLDLYGLYALNGKDADRKVSQDEGFSNDRSSYGIGVKFTMPLDVLAVTKQQRGYALEEKAAELQLYRKEFESVRDWEDAVKSFQEGLNRYKILLRIETAQSKKLKRERDLQSRGRSTLFQVLQFESEFAATQIARTRAQVDLLSLHAILKTYPEATSKE